MQYSTTYARVLVIIAGAFGMTLADDMAVEIVTAVITLATAADLLRKRHAEGGIHWHGLRK
jgi:hypothetical protein